MERNFTANLEARLKKLNPSFMSDETVAATPKFAPGQLVSHPLGFQCMIQAAYDSKVDPETKESSPLGFFLYDLQFLDKNGCLQTTRLSEQFIVC